MNPLRNLLAAAVCFLLALPFLANAFIRLNYERYVWVIQQPGACAYLGSGPRLLSVAVFSWIAALAAFGLLLLSRPTPGPWFPRPGFYAGVGAVLFAAAVVVSVPSPVAFALGCR